VSAESTPEEDFCQWLLQPCASNPPPLHPASAGQFMLFADQSPITRDSTINIHNQQLCAGVGLTWNYVARQTIFSKCVGGYNGRSTDRNSCYCAEDRHTGAAVTALYTALFHSCYSRAGEHCWGRVSKMSYKFEEILLRARGNFKEQNNVLESSVSIINYSIYHYYCY
jgi:hypothetical protein